MTEPLSIPPTLPVPVEFSILNFAGVVGQDVPCSRCSYNLRGLSPAGVCPECGTRVMASLRGTLLRFSDPAWVRTLARGAQMIIYAIAVWIVGGILAAIFGAASGIPLLPQGVGVIANVMLLVGSWLLTEPDPSGRGEDAYGTSRKVIRICLILGAFNQAMTLAYHLAPLPGTLATVFSGLSILLAIAGVVGMFAELQYLSKLALRIPDIERSVRAGFLMWAIAISYGSVILLSAVAGWIVAASGSRPSTAGLAALGCPLGLAFLALMVFAIMYLLLVEKLARQFREEAAAADQNWAQVTAMPPMTPRAV